ncbi:hypothetical protein SDC9_11257 [bioreactor metagenome]|uniref:Fungal lipase-type domain-containing protein n=1 Tax=bioreactor metagenome TaxID=1076179 RepID=A0A644TFB1_9ZZZZ|nr:lipase family protein [Negativicutes bacterium]
MKRFFIIILTFILLYTPFTGHAEPKKDYEEAYKLYIAAGASVATYSGRIGELATSYLKQNGWQITNYIQPQGRSGARFLVAKKDLDNNHPFYVLAIVGTENKADVKIDLKVDKVYFTDSNAEEFATNTQKELDSSTEPMVHKGFNEFTQSIPSAILSDAPHNTAPSLLELLMSNKNSKLYITGHSLGGAAATLTGAKLISEGINPDQIEVITFGAPAVGNKAFAAKFEPTLNLTRVVISGDMATGVLQTLVGGYQQFGREIKWDNSNTVDDPHKLIGYVDLALKNYYDKRHEAITAGVDLPTPKVSSKANHGRAYIAPLQQHMPDTLTEDLWYMREALKDEYQKTLSDCTIANKTETGDWLKKAAAAGYQWVIVPEVSAFRLKQEKNAYNIILSQTVYDVATGDVIDTGIFSTGTYNLTPLEAFIHALNEMRSHQKNWNKISTDFKKGWSIDHPF